MRYVNGMRRLGQSEDFPLSGLDFLIAMMIASDGSDDPPLGDAQVEAYLLKECPTEQTPRGVITTTLQDLPLTPSRHCLLEA